MGKLIYCFYQLGRDRKWKGCIDLFMRVRLIAYDGTKVGVLCGAMVLAGRKETVDMCLESLTDLQAC